MMRVELHGGSTDDIDRWLEINEVIQNNMTPEIKKRWMSDGYEGLNECALDYFGINRIYRNEQNYVTFEFTEQQWVMFLLRWL
jgi:hypothetical protein